MTEVKTASGRNAHSTRVKVTFVGKGGVTANRPMEGVEAIKVLAVETGVETTVTFGKLSAKLAMMIMAHGAGVLLRNTVNTNADASSAAEDMLELAAAWEEGKFYPTSTRSNVVPQVLRAMARAFEKAGKSEDFVAEKISAYMAQWNADAADEKALAKQRREISKKLLAAPAIAAALIELQQEAARKPKATAEVDLDAI